MFQVENHLATFSKLIGTDRQHNTVETAEVRYVYQPIESLILVLTTSKVNQHQRSLSRRLAVSMRRIILNDNFFRLLQLSNIVEDLETLRLFSKLIPEHW